MLDDIRYALRTLRQNPGFSLTAIASIALAIGANSSIFSFADALLLRPLAVREPSRVVTIRSIMPSRSASSLANTGGEMSYPDYEDFRDKSRSFDGVVAYDLKAVGFAHDANSQAQVKMGFTVSGNFFQVLGVEPQQGRGFRPEEDQVPARDAVIVLSHDLWQRDFAADSSIIGRRVRLNGLDFEVIGVAPESFTGMDQFLRPSFYVPFMMAAALDPNETVVTKRDNRSIGVKARLKPGVSLEEANADVSAIATALERTYPATNRAVAAAVRSETRMRLDRAPVYGPLIAALFILVILVLLIACCNVANLMLGRGRARAREIAVRIALGSSRARLVRQLMTENLLIALAGGTLGLTIARTAVEFFSRVEVVGDIPIQLAFELNDRVLLFTLAVSVLSPVLFGLVPALQSTAFNLVPALKGGDLNLNRKRFFGRNALVVVQVAVSLVLLIAASRVYRGAIAMSSADHAFRVERTLTMRLDTEIPRYSPAQTEQFYKTLIERSAEVPGLKSAALAFYVPLTTNPRTKTVIPEGYQFPAGQTNLTVFEGSVDDRYFQTFGVPILKGRGFAPSDTANSPRVAIVNDTFAHDYLGPEPVGRRIRLNGADGPWLEVVGVVATGPYLAMTEQPTGFLYLPLSQNPERRLTLIVESAGDPAGLSGPLRELVRSIDSNVPILAVRTMDEIFEKASVLGVQLVTTVFAVASLMGLVLAVVGLYAVVAYQAERRTREIGIRMALGAQRLHVMRMILKHAAQMGVSGVVIGLVLSLFSGGALTMGRATTPDLLVFALVPTVLLLITFAAAAIPACRAAQVDPIRALRQD